MNGRPPQLPFPATRVLKAVSAQVLPSGHKLTWLEIYALDHSPDGVYLAATDLGARVGLKNDAVEIQRRDLADMGLLVRLSIERGSGVGWRPVMPADCIPVSRAPSPGEINRLARRLEAHIVAFGQRAMPAKEIRTDDSSRHAADGRRQAYPDTPPPPQDSRKTSVSEPGGLEKDRKNSPTSSPPDDGVVANAEMRSERQEPPLAAGADGERKALEVPESGDPRFDELLRRVARLSNPPLAAEVKDSANDSRGN